MTIDQTSDRSSLFFWHMFQLYRLHRLIHEIWGLTIQKRGHLGCRMFQVYPVPSSVKTCCSASGSHPLVEGLPGHPAWVSEVPWTNMSAFIKISHWMDSASSFIMFHIYDRLMIPIPIDTLFPRCSDIWQVLSTRNSSESRLRPVCFQWAVPKTLWAGRRRTEGLTWTYHLPL